MKRRLYRSRREAWLGGVAAGIADYFDIDPVIVRLVWLFTIFLGGSGIVAYVIAWVLIPPHPDEPIDPRFEGARNWSETVVETVRETSNPRQVLGWILVIVGIVVLMLKLIPVILVVLGALWPLILIILGIALLIQGMRR